MAYQPQEQLPTLRHISYTFANARRRYRQQLCRVCAGLLLAFACVCTAQPQTPLQTNQIYLQPTNTQAISKADKVSPLSKTSAQPALATTPQNKSPSNKINYFSSDWVLVYLTGFIALFTCALAWYTARLFRATYKMVINSDATAERQSREMQRSIDASNRSAAAMEEAARNSATSSRAAVESVETLKERTALQMRAYLTVVIGTGIYQERMRNLRFEVKPLLINTGHTPAHNVRYKATANVVRYPLPDGFEFLLPQEPVGRYVLGPQQNLILNAHVTGNLLDDDIAEQIKWGTGEGRLYIWGIVTYDDIFGVEHYTRFCHFIYWIQDPNNPANTTIAGIYTDRHNDAD